MRSDSIERKHDCEDVNWQLAILSQLQLKKPAIEAGNGVIHINGQTYTSKTDSDKSNGDVWGTVCASFQAL
ncbi:hypothetical protein CIPAW_05G182200 [Carya illinoinensis]|uniref:Uncharacterized protein n=1 Tax=Carya illinoinensis TaxID=32201 RepID=A0A8T1QL21_CARIL|nr:hypothetical protein CIPAW_05G182200 [Carya illinoinensis]